jgi:TIR domain
MPVFISYKSEDARIALYTHDHLKNKSILCYLDQFDSSLSSGSVTSKLIRRIEQCTHLLGIVSIRTQNSW